jgi:MarR family transcriptional regulator, organic hydroperoxide resistance regulator
VLQNVTKLRSFFLDDYRLYLAETIKSMVDHFEELRGRWTTALGVSGPQWLILIALAGLDEEGQGVPAAAISEYLQIDITYVVIESRKLEKKGFLHLREIAGRNAVYISLTMQSRALIARLGVR